jgi:septum formation protein
VQFSKPTDKEDALRILKALSGKTHSVITGVSIVRNGFAWTDSAEAKVTFNSVTDEQILSYIETGDPMDKAGAYGAQGMGNFLVESINGEFDTVIGLPVNLVRALLTKASASIPQ